MIKTSLGSVSMILILTIEVWAQVSIVNTRHNLSVYGPGELKATTEEQVCIFCHATHSGSGQAPLWNRYDSAVTYTLYGSPTMQSGTLQPELDSRLCLSCHDGTVALGLVRNRTGPISFPLGMDKIPPGYRSNLASDLADDHPLTLDFNPHPSGEYTCSGCHTSTAHNLECSSCHNPHDNTYGDFLIADPINGGICLRCHAKTNWDTSIHKLSSASWNGTLPDPWPYTEWNTVSENACTSCHDPHGNPSPYWLLKYAAEEENCYVCHNGNVAATDIENDMLKLSVHPVTDYNNLHTPNEDPLTMSRHVECSDCHNPHQVDQTSASPSAIPGSLKGVQGVDQNGNVVANAANEYEVCYKCHQNGTGSTTYYVPRVDAQSSIRLEFADTNPSYHPVVAEGRNANVPSLISPYTINSLIYCSDCHNDDEADLPGGANGPHGSSYEPILKDQMVFTDGNPESQTIYALCYQCHDRNSILNDEDGFEHRRHIKRAKAACTTCHDPHGSYNNTHLINFNSDYVSPSRKQNRIEFIDNGVSGGECYLRCHGNNHEPRDY